MVKKPTYEELEKKVKELEKQWEKVKNAEEFFLESEERFRTIVESTTDCILVWDQEYNYIYANQAAIDHVGTTSGKVIDKNIHDGLGHIPEFMDLWKSRIDEIFATGRPMRVEDKIPVGDRVVYSESVLSPILDADGKMFAVGVVYRDVSERKEAEQALKTSEQRLSNLAQIINFLPDATFVIDTEGKVIAWNQAIENMTGIKAQEMLGKGDYEYSIPFYGERRPILIDLVGKWDKEIEKKYQYIIKEGESLVSKTHDPLVRPGGYLWNKASLLYDHNGEVIGAIESIRDITDRKAAEEELLLKDLVFQASITANSISNNKGILTHVNDAFIRTWGYENKEEMVGKTIRDFLKFENEAAKIIAALQEPGEWEGECTALRKDGSTFSAYGLATIIKDKSGEVIGYQSIVLDISDQKQTEKTLRESEKGHRELYNLLRLMTDNVPDLIFAKDMEMRYIFANRAMCKRLLNARDTDEPTGKTHMYFADRERKAHPKDPHWHDFGETCTDSDSVVMKTKKAQRFDEFGNVRGKYLHLDVNKAPFLDDRGKMIGIVGCARDVTKEKEIEKELQSAHDELERGVEERAAELVVVQDQLIRSERLAASGQLAGAVAHEINSPLQAITIILGMLSEQERENSEMMEKLDILTEAFGDIRDTVKNLLDLNRPGKEEKQQINVNNIIEKTVDLLKSHFSKSKVKVNMNLSSRVPDILASAQQLSHLFLNLINNAMEAMTGESKSKFGRVKRTIDREINIRTKLRKGNVVIEVSDTGPGISDEDLHHIFDPFYTRKKKMGMGVGLSICHGFVEDHGGVIVAKNSPEGGAVFTITLPC